MVKITVSVIKADIGGYVGHSRSHPEILRCAEGLLGKAKGNGLISDFRVMACGDDLELIMTHHKGTGNSEIHRLAWDSFVECTNLAKKLKLYGAGQDLLKDTFSGNVKGMGPGAAEMEFEERTSEPLVVFMADKTSPGAWNMPLYKMFADPFTTAGLVIDPAMCDGFKFKVLDVLENKVITLSCPDEMYQLLVFLGAVGRYVITEVRRRKDNEIGAVASSDKLSLIAGKYVGKDDPVMMVRAQAGFPAVGEILEAFSFPHLVPGFMRGSHQGPLTPVSFDKANPSRFDGPPRVIAAGFQLSNGLLEGPVDLFDDPSFDLTREKSSIIAEYIRRHGPFEPHRLSLEEMEYTTLPKIAEKLKERWEKFS
jgi:fructose 1,6-bisphosphate aldolase/phosphatase